MLILTIASFACTLAVETSEERDGRVPLLGERPSVILLAPQTGNRYALGAEISIYLQAQDKKTGITRIEVMDSFDTLLGTVTAQNPQGELSLSGTIQWKPTAAQTYLLRAQAYRVDEVASNPQEISVVVVEGQNVPVVNVPANATSNPAITPDGIATEQIVTLSGVVRGANALNVRSNPNASAPFIAPALTEGEDMQILGRSEDQEWYLIRLDNGDFGWVFGQFVEVSGDINTLPTVKPDEVN